MPASAPARGARGWPQAGGALLLAALTLLACGDGDEDRLSEADRKRVSAIVRTYVELRWNEAQQGRLTPRSASRLRAITDPEAFGELQAEARATAASDPPNRCRTETLEVHDDDPNEIWVDAALSREPFGGGALGVAIERRRSGWRVVHSARDPRFDAQNRCRATSCAE